VSLRGGDFSAEFNAGLGIIWLEVDGEEVETARAYTSLDLTCIGFWGGLYLLKHR
jgi:hypothetical protein